MPGDLLIQNIRPQKDEQQFSDLLDRCFQVKSGQHYLDDFPVWREQQPEILKMGAYDGERLIGAAAVRIADVNAPQHTFSAGLIGAVATDGEFRGRGIATKLVSLATDWAANRGAALAVLWGAEHALYAKIGYFPCGVQVRVPLSSIRAQAELPAYHTGWNPAIFKLLQTRKRGVLFSEIDRLWYSEHKNVKWFWTGPKGRPTAYAALGRGIDLTHIVHEWGGSRPELLSLLGEIAKIDPQAELLGSPETFSEVGVQYDPSRVEYLCLANLLDPTRVARAFIGVERVPGFSASLINDYCLLKYQDSSGQTSELSVPKEGLAGLFFGPALSSPPQPPWSGHFPIPLWFWGLDAV